jgi:RHS repeat-associated protein
VTVTDPGGRWKKYETDVFGNVIKAIEPNPQGGADHETTYAYDMLNRLTTVTMPRSGTTQTRTFTYNTAGQLQSTINPENSTTTLAYNTDGLLFSKTDQKAQRIEYSYDLFQRVTEVRKYLPGNQNDDPCQRVNYYYDTNPFDSYFTQNGWGRLTVAQYGAASCTGGRFRESYSYTSGGLPLKKKLWVNAGDIGTGSLLGEWSYDNEGKMLTVKYPDTLDGQGNPATGRTYTYGYDSMGRLSTLVDNRPGDPPGWTWVEAATYNVAGQLTSLAGWNGLSETREYNERLQVTRINNNGYDIHYFYPDLQNNDGRITQRNVNGVNTTYTYDSLGRLATAGTASYTYDGFGNRLQQTSPPMDLTYYASNNRIATTGYAYDENGSLTAMPGLTMSYDVENRLVQAVDTLNGTERYRYAPSGQRVWKQKPLGTNEWYFYGLDGRLIGTYVPCQYYETLFQEQSTNVYFGGRTLQAQGQPAMKQDRLGTVGAPNYAPYGDTVIYPPPYGDGLGFTGYYRDGTSTGLDYAQQRYYAPAIGRFTTADPCRASATIARPQSWNRYAYVENDPVNAVDPDGRFAEWLWGGTPGEGELAACMGFGMAGYDPLLCSLGSQPLGRGTEYAWGVSERAWVEDLFLGDTDFVDSIDYEGNGSYRLQLTAAGVLAFMPQIAGVGAGGAIVLAGGPVTWTTVGTVVGVIAVAGMTYATIIALKDAVEKAKKAWEEEQKRCAKVAQECREECSETALPTTDYGFGFFNCVNRCKAAAGCL